MLGDLAQQGHTSIGQVAVVREVAVGVNVDCPTHQTIACHQVQHGRLLFMKNHKTNGSTMVKWGTSRPQKQVRELGA